MPEFTHDFVWMTSAVAFLEMLYKDFSSHFPISAGRHSSVLISRRKLNPIAKSTHKKQPNKRVFSDGGKGNLKRQLKRNQREHPAHNSFNRLVLCFLLQFQSPDNAHPGRKELHKPLGRAKSLAIESNATLVRFSSRFICAKWRKKEVQRNCERHFNNINVHSCVSDAQQRNKQILCSLHKSSAESRARRKLKGRQKRKKLPFNQIRIGSKKCCVCPARCTQARAT